MSLLNPNPGEIIDRLTILELKITAASKKYISAVHFEAEELGLKERLKHFEDCLAEDFCTKEGLFGRLTLIAESKNTLAAVNSLLWQAEDEVRATPDEEPLKLASLCKRITKWNDVRSRHVALLNKLYNTDEGPEKLHDSVLDGAWKCI